MDNESSDLHIERKAAVRSSMAPWLPRSGARTQVVTLTVTPAAVAQRLNPQSMLADSRAPTKGESERVQGPRSVDPTRVNDKDGF